MMQFEDFKTNDLTFEFVVSMSDYIRQQVIKDYNQLEKRGSIGDCELRTQTENLMYVLKISTVTISPTIVMGILTDAIYKYYTMKHFNVI